MKNKKFVGAICVIILIVCSSICSLGYILGKSNFPWWLIIFAGGIVCGCLYLISDMLREEDKDKKHIKLMSCICSAISMVSVFTFLLVDILFKIQNSWIIVFIGGIVIGIITMIDRALKEKNK